MFSLLNFQKKSQICELIRDSSSSLRDIKTIPKQEIKQQHMKKKVNKNWYNSKNVRPKTFSLTVERTARGGYRIVRGDLVDEINQHAARIQRVDARDLTQDIKSKGGIFAL